MSNRAYILLDIVGGKAEKVAQALQGSPGVVMADAVEGSSDIVLVMEAPNRQQLAKLTIQALASVESTTEGVCLLPARDEIYTATSSKLFRQSKGTSKKGVQSGFVTTVG